MHLETRCDGQTHGGCQAACLIFWKEDWLKPVGRTSCDNAAHRPAARSEGVKAATSGGCSESNVWSHTQAPNSNGGAPKFICQATQLPYATKDLAWWDIRQYVEDYVSGKVGLKRILGGLVYSMYYHLSEAGIGLGPAMRWFYDRFHPLWRGTLFPGKLGTIPVGDLTPTAALDLQPGELVRVKPHAEILRTLNTENKNRGRYFDAEMVPYCGGSYRVFRESPKSLMKKQARCKK